MQVKQKYTGNVDWYLYNLSVFSKVQEKGITSKLLRPMFNFCDKENIVCYLETDKNSNVSLYKHFGFELVHKGLIPKSDFMPYVMIRKQIQQQYLFFVIYFT